MVSLGVGLGARKRIDCFGPRAHGSSGARGGDGRRPAGAAGRREELRGWGCRRCGPRRSRRAAKVCPIMFTEIEFSLWSREMLGNGGGGGGEGVSRLQAGMGER